MSQDAKAFGGRFGAATARPDRMGDTYSHNFIDELEILF